ncbi:hypothetical protein ACWDRR_42680 [Kitasatospora sp. NPDC003701]
MPARKITRRALAGLAAGAALTVGLSLAASTPTEPRHVADSVWGAVAPEPTPTVAPEPTATLADSVWG